MLPPQLGQQCSPAGQFASERKGNNAGWLSGTTWAQWEPPSDRIEAEPKLQSTSMAQSGDSGAGWYKSKAADRLRPARRRARARRVPGAELHHFRHHQERSLFCPSPLLPVAERRADTARFRPGASRKWPAEQPDTRWPAPLQTCDTALAREEATLAGSGLMDPADDVSGRRAGRLLTLTGARSTSTFQASASAQEGASAPSRLPLSWLRAIRWPKSTSWLASSPNARSSWL